MNDFDGLPRRDRPVQDGDAEDLLDLLRPMKLGSAVAPDPARNAAAGSTELESQSVEGPVASFSKSTESASSLADGGPQIPTSKFERHIPEILRERGTRKTKLSPIAIGLLCSAKMPARKAYTDADLTPFGRRLKEAFESAGYSQTSFGRAAGFGKATMTRLLYDAKLQGISFDNMERIEFLTGMRIQWLALGQEPKRDIEPASPMKKAAALARNDGIPEDVIAHIARRYELAPWDVHGWYRTFHNAFKRAANDDAWYQDLRRVSLEKKIISAAQEKADRAKAQTVSVEDAQREIAK